MSWKPPELPQVQRPPPKRSDGQPSYVGRALGGLLGVVLIAVGAIGVYQALRDRTGTKNPFMSLAMLLPAVILIRYAVTGRIKAN